MASGIVSQLSRRSFIRGAALAPIAPLAAQLAMPGASPAPVASDLEQLRAVDPELADLFVAAMASTLALVREAPQSGGLRSAKALTETTAKACGNALQVHRQGEKLEAAGLGAWRKLLGEQAYAYRVAAHHMEDLVNALERAPHAHAVAILEAYRDRLPDLDCRDVLELTYLVRHPGADAVPESVFAVLD